MNKCISILGLIFLISCSGDTDTVDNSKLIGPMFRVNHGGGGGGGGGPVTWFVNTDSSFQYALENFYPGDEIMLTDESQLNWPDGINTVNNVRISGDPGTVILPLKPAHIAFPSDPQFSGWIDFVHLQLFGDVSAMTDFVFLNHSLSNGIFWNDWKNIVVEDSLDIIGTDFINTEAVVTKVWSGILWDNSNFQNSSSPCGFWDDLYTDPFGPINGTLLSWRRGAGSAQKTYSYEVMGPIVRDSEALVQGGVAVRFTANGWQDFDNSQLVDVTVEYSNIMSPPCTDLNTMNAVFTSGFWRTVVPLEEDFYWRGTAMLCDSVYTMPCTFVDYSEL